MTILTVTAVAIAGCGGPPPSPRAAIPPEFGAACGHPGARVTVRKVPVTISHAGCDLTGVAIFYPGYGGRRSRAAAAASGPAAASPWRSIPAPWT